MGKMMELAMGLSMSSLICETMNENIKNSSQLVRSNRELAAPLQYIYAVIKGKQQGPFSIGEVISLIQSGDIGEQTFIWKQGMKEWVPAKEVCDLQPSFDMLPPTLNL